MGGPQRVTSGRKVAQLTPSLSGFVEAIFAVQGDQRDWRFCLQYRHNQSCFRSLNHPILPPVLVCVVFFFCFVFFVVFAK